MAPEAFVSGATSVGGSASSSKRPLEEAMTTAGLLGGAGNRSSYRRSLPHKKRRPSKCEVAAVLSCAYGGPQMTMATTKVTPTNDISVDESLDLQGRDIRLKTPTGTAFATYAAGLVAQVQQGSSTIVTAGQVDESVMSPLPPSPPLKLEGNIKNVVKCGAPPPGPPLPPPPPPPSGTSSPVTSSSSGGSYNKSSSNSTSNNNNNEAWMHRLYPFDGPSIEDVTPLFRDADIDQVVRDKLSVLHDENLAAEVMQYRNDVIKLDCGGVQDGRKAPERHPGRRPSVPAEPWAAQVVQFRPPAGGTAQNQGQQDVLYFAL